MIADVGRDVDPDHRRRPGLGKSGSPVALAASNIEHPLAAHEFLREPITADVLPENSGMGLLGHHALREMAGVLIVTHTFPLGGWKRVAPIIAKETSRRKHGSGGMRGLAGTIGSEARRWSCDMDRAAIAPSGAGFAKLCPCLRCGAIGCVQSWPARCRLDPRRTARGR